MKTKTWREIAAPIIADALKKTEGEHEGRIKKALFEAYPFGERKYHPYKIWLDEIKVQRGLKKRKSNLKTEDPNQKNLF